MNLVNIFTFAQIAVCVVLTIAILMQNRAEGLGKMFGGGGEVFRTKRGLEKFLYTLTIILVGVLVILSLLILKFS
jgi:preprotein translocase subunit SecG